MNMNDPERWPPLARLLPGDYPARLAWAAEVHDLDRVDAITDELARLFPRLVRPRRSCGWFRPMSTPTRRRR